MVVVVVVSSIVWPMFSLAKNMSYSPKVWVILKSKYGLLLTFQNYKLLSKSRVKMDMGHHMPISSSVFIVNECFKMTLSMATISSS